MTQDGCRDTNGLVLYDYNDIYVVCASNERLMINTLSHSKAIAKFAIV